MLDKIIMGLAGLIGLLVFGIGVRWLVDPSGAAPMIGMEVLPGVAGNSQIGDLGTFFLVGGGFALLALITRNPTLLYTPAALMGTAAIVRVVAGTVHDTTLAPDMIVGEVVMCAVFLAARSRMAAAAQ